MMEDFSPLEKKILNIKREIEWILSFGVGNGKYQYELMDLNIDR